MFTYIQFKNVTHFIVHCTASKECQRSTKRDFDNDFILIFDHLIKSDYPKRLTKSVFVICQLFDPVLFFKKTDAATSKLITKALAIHDFKRARTFSNDGTFIDYVNWFDQDEMC